MPASLEDIQEENMYEENKHVQPVKKLQLIGICKLRGKTIKNAWSYQKLNLT